MTTAGCSAASSSGTSSPSRILTTLAAVALYVLSGTLVEVLLGGGKFTAEDVATTSLVVAAFALSVPFDALAYPLSRGLYATHDTLRQVIASFAGLGVVIVASQLARARRPGSSRSRSATRPGCSAKDTLLAIFLAARVRRIGSVGYGALSVGTTAMYRPSRSG